MFISGLGQFAKVSMRFSTEAMSGLAMSSPACAPELTGSQLENFSGCLGISSISRWIADATCGFSLPSGKRTGS